jgi:hypothetical protein
MKKLEFTLLFILTYYIVNSQIYTSSTIMTEFSSRTPIESFAAKSTTGNAATNIKTGKLIFKIPLKSFSFPNQLMQEHFNDNYLESEKYPIASFEGKIVDLPDLRKPGEYTLKVRGIFILHGVEKSKEFIANFIIQNDTIIESNAYFKLRPKEFKIQIPNLIVEKIADEIDVIINAKFSLKN